MGAQYRRPSEVINPRKRDSLRREIQDLRDRQTKPLVVPGSRGDGDTAAMVGRLSRFIDPHVRENKGLLARKQRELEEVLANGSPDSLSRVNKARLERRLQELTERLRRHMCPKRIYKARSVDDPGIFKKATAACLQEQSEPFKKMANEFKQIKRELEPDDPTAASLENIRPK